MNKQGMAYWQIIFAFYLVVAIIVILILGLRAKYVLSDEDYVDAYSKITALTITSMFYSDYYDMEVVLDVPKLFDVEILDDEVKVSLGGTEKEYNYIPSKNFKINAERKGDKLILKKVKG